MGNAIANSGACAACCSELQKSAPYIQYVSENPCFDEDSSLYNLQMGGFPKQPTHVVTSMGQVAPTPVSLPVAAVAAAAVGERSPAAAASQPKQQHQEESSQLPATDAAALAASGASHGRPCSTSVAPQAPVKCTLDSERQSVAAVSEVGSGLAVSAAASDSTASTMMPDVGQAQQVVKNFVRAYVKGRDVAILSVNGGVATCFVSLDRKLTTLSLQRSGKKDSKKRGIPLEEIAEICVGEEAGEDVDLLLDEMCVTLLLREGQAVGFRFDDVEDRDTFALCLSMFVDGRRGEVKKRKSSKQKAGGA